MSSTSTISERPVRRKTVFVKIAYDDQIKKVLGTYAQEEHGPGSLAVYDEVSIVARFTNGVERWWIEEK